MIARKTQKIIYNILILCFLIGGATYVCSRFIHLGNIEYTDNAQVKQHITPPMRKQRIRMLYIIF